MRDSWLREFWRYRELFFFFVWRDIKVRYKQTALGALWAIIQPFFLMVVFTLFFGNMAKMPSDGVPYPIFSFAALVPWTFFQQSVSMSGNSLVTNADLIRKVYFPRVCLPSSSVFAGVLDFAIASVVLAGMMFYYQFEPTWSLLLWPVLMVPLMLLAIGVGMILSALNVKYRDIKYTIPFMLQMWLFLSPVIYPTSEIDERYLPLMALNPVAGLINAFRATVLPTKEVDVQELAISVGLSLLVFVIGMLYFKKTERAFADII